MKNEKQGSTKKKNWQYVKCFVEADLLIYKGFCFFIYGAFGSLYPYLPLYFKQFGLTSFQTGIIVGVRPLIQIVGAPFWTVIGDWFRAERIVLLFGILAWLVKALVILAVYPHQQVCIETFNNVSTNTTYIYTSDLWHPGEESEVKWTIVPSFKFAQAVQKNRLTKVSFSNHGKSISVRSDEYVNYVEKYGKQSLRNTAKSGKKALKDDAIETFRSRQLKAFKNKETEEAKSSEIGLKIIKSAKRYNSLLNTKLSYKTQIDLLEVDHLFLIFLLIIIIGEFLESPTYALSDASLLDRLGDDRTYYGQIRLWGAVGWAIATGIVGVIVHDGAVLLCGSPLDKYTYCFYVFIGMVCMAMFFASRFKFKGNEESQESGIKKALTALSSPEHIIFLVAVLYTGCCYGFLFHFVNWYIDDKGGSTLVMGAAGATREVGELVFFLIGGTLVTFVGNIHTMAICLISYSACFYCYSIITSPWYAVALEGLDGAIYGLLWSNCVNYMSTLGAKLGTVMTMQGVLQGVFYGLGNGGGTIASGAIYGAFGAEATFHYFAFCGLVVLLLFLLLHPLAIGRTAETNTITLEEIEYERISTQSDADENAELELDDSRNGPSQGKEPEDFS